MQAGIMPVLPCPVDLREIVGHSLAGIHCPPRAVMVSIPPGLPQVMADPAIMERVVANLTANALQYAPDGSPARLTARVRGDQVQLCIIDHGPGVPEADRNRMFAPFQRLRDTGPGVGLGLAVSLGLTEAMHGTLESKETPGGGLTMTISLPAAPIPARRDGPEASHTYPGSEEAAR